MKQIKIIIEARIPQELFGIFSSVGFWNEQGPTIFEKNKSGEMGSKASQRKSRKTDYETFVLEYLAIDCKTVCEHKPFKAGRSGSHIWVSDNNNNRLILIYFEKTSDVIENQINSHRKYAIAFIEQESAFSIDELALHEIFEPDFENGEEKGDGGLSEFKYAMQYNIDAILDLRVGERLAMFFNRDNKDSEGFVKRIR